MITMNTALFFDKKENDYVQCRLCPHNCLLGPDKSGVCSVRKNVCGSPATENYGIVSALHLDPIEKKPLYHFFPGSKILSLGSIGCNMQCPFCQNYEISQRDTFSLIHDRRLLPGEVVDICKNYPESIGIAFTYNEPTVYFEFMYETAQKSKEAGLVNVMVSNGFINPEPLKELLPCIDAFNLDIKSFSNAFYQRELKGSLEAVKDSCRLILDHKKHLEISYLVVPGKNDEDDQFEKLIFWIRLVLGKNVPLHLSRYFPAYRYHAAPTAPDLLEKCYHIASKYLNYVYVGNIHIGSYEDTSCAYCGHTLINRNRYQVKINEIKPNGHCANCNHKIIEV